MSVVCVYIHVHVCVRTCPHTGDVVVKSWRPVPFLSVSDHTSTVTGSHATVSIDEDIAAIQRKFVTIVEEDRTAGGGGGGGGVEAVSKPPPRPPTLTTDQPVLCAKAFRILSVKDGSALCASVQVVRVWACMCVCAHVCS